MVLAGSISVADSEGQVWHTKIRAILLVTENEDTHAIRRPLRSNRGTGHAIRRRGIRCGDRTMS
jgi:hypothetical protein